ncbi:alpha/beta fold hydrolase [Nitrogeniibacter mangrovi]|uniref:Alpha/beta fold hydrolase n=1 Tax=Nitrogeniibacter mangrovi TaxID=2016596 RepID=A0A6C1B9C9_9RHOO|nr:alpha/beta fold hydrolase [Nitrogeniibacter mangrovi]QID19445.1 alpha/beta fold hydrolase [Nitrogeniibacter mangrovi]
MEIHPYYNADIHGPYARFELGDFTLEDGGTLRNAHLAYHTLGTLNASKDNVILVPTWFSGTSRIMIDVYTGEGRALDPARHFIIFVNQIGNGLSSSPHNTPSPFDGPNFPRVRIGDDVRAQHRLVTEHFGISRLALVVGGSMGAQQTYEWAVRYPDMVARAAPIAGTAANTPHDVIFAQTLMDTITCDPLWAGGDYPDSHAVRAGLRRHARLWAVMGFSTEMFRKARWRELGFSSLDDFLVGFLDAYFLPMDPNDLLCMAWKWQRADVARHTGGNLAAALERIRAKVFVMPIDEDMFFPVRDCAAEQALIPGSELRPIHSEFGHLGLFGLEPSYFEQIDRHLGELLALPA